MPKEPLYPHVPKSRQPKSPTITREIKKITLGNDWSGEIGIYDNVLAIPDWVIIKALKQLGAIKDDEDHPNWNFDSEGELNYDERLPSGRISTRTPQYGWRKVTIDGFRYAMQSVTWGEIPYSGQIYGQFIRTYE